MIPYPMNNPPSPNQQWHLDYQPDGSFLIVSQLNGKVLDCGGQGQGQNLFVWDRHGGENQRFKMEGNCLVTMRGLVVDISGSNQAPGAPLVLWSRNYPPSNNQQFSIISVSALFLCMLLYFTRILTSALCPAVLWSQ